ncbi:MAG: hypothetical protein AAGN46_05505, partial [Acidobacteriota bacterium]
MTRDEKLVWIFLLTSPLTEPIGVVRVSPGGLAVEVARDMPDEVARAALRRLEELGLCTVSPHGPLVVIHRMHLYQPPANPSVVKGWARIVRQIPPCEVLDRHLEDLYCYVSTLGKAYAQAALAWRPTESAQSPPRETQHATNTHHHHKQPPHPQS